MKIRVMIVEDEVIVARDLAATLERSGCEIVGMERKAESALEKCETLRPDLLVVDVKLAGAMDGIDFVKALKTSMDIPVVYLTAQSDEGTLERIADTDPSGYLTKPVNHQELVANVTQSARRFKAERDLRETEARWQYAIDGTGDGLYDWDCESGKVFTSRRYGEMLGFAGEAMDFTFEWWNSIVHPDDIGTAKALLEDHLSGRTDGFVAEYRMRHVDGSYVWILDRGKVVEKRNDGSPRRLIGTHTDMTERRAMEEALRESEFAYRNLFDWHAGWFRLARDHPRPRRESRRLPVP
jgi:PAS domain S-box-containing protein